MRGVNLYFMYIEFWNDLICSDIIFKQKQYW